MRLDESYLAVTRKILRQHGHDIVGPNITPPPGYVTLEHFNVACQKFYAERAIDMLAWAAEMGATIPEMLAWDRAQNGEDLA